MKAFPLLKASAAALCVLPLWTAAQDCPPSASADYILGEAQGMPSAMHWDSGLVWARCAAGQAWDGASCTGAAAEAYWYHWTENSALLPQSFAGQERLDIATGPDQNPLARGGWRLPYRSELAGIGAGCSSGPRINQAVFPATSAWVWTASPHPEFPELAWAANLHGGYTDIAYKPIPLPVLLVRGGQPFAPLQPSGPLAATAGQEVQSGPIVLEAAAGTLAWGGMRIAGAGDPAFQVNDGPWTREAIVASGDIIRVRLTAPAAVGEAQSATLTLRSGQTTGTAANAANAGGESTTVQESTAIFSVSAAAAGS
ncbi:hypothetical protein GCM10027082_09430 [Comamonas humi]